MRMSVISDCNADSVIIRVPQELAVLMVKSIADTSDGQELIKKMVQCHSSKLSELLKKYELYDHEITGGNL